MKERQVFKTSIFMLVIIALAFVSCSDEDSGEIEAQTIDMTEVMRASEVDVAGETISDIIIDSYENQESSELNRTASNQSYLLKVRVLR